MPSPSSGNSAIAQSSRTAIIISCSPIDDDSRVWRITDILLSLGFRVRIVGYNSETANGQMQNNRAQVETHLCRLPRRSISNRIQEVLCVLTSRLAPPNFSLKLLSMRPVVREIHRTAQVLASNERTDLVVAKHWNSFPTALSIQKKLQPIMWFDINEVFKSEHDMRPVWVFLYRKLIERLVKLQVQLDGINSYTSLEQIRFEQPERAVYLPNVCKPILNFEDRRHVDSFKLIYHGLIIENRGLETVLHALKRSQRKDIQLTIRGDGKPHYVEKIKRNVELLELQDQVTFEPKIPNIQVVHKAADFDVGLCIFNSSSAQVQLAEPNKIYEYVAAGVGIIGTKTPTLERLVKQKGAGETIVNLEELTMCFASLDRKSIELWRKNALIAAQNYYSEFKERREISVELLRRLSNSQTGGLR